MYDLMVAKPHEPQGSRFTAEQYDLYRAGYRWALVMALRCMEHADARYKLYLRTRRLDTRRRRESARDA